MSFIEKLLPSQGLICVAVARGKGFKHYFCDGYEQAQQQITALDAQGHSVYLAQATFRTNESRKQTNAQALRNFFFDIDCGDGKDYPSQKAAADALKKFVSETGLPFPAVTNSGNGLYAHWIIDEDIPADNWKTFARILKKTAAAYEFATDPVRTADSASVLRPPGTTNRKTIDKPVRLIRDMEPVPLDQFVKALEAAAKRKKVDQKELAPPTTSLDPNHDFYSGIEVNDIQYNAERCADKCAQLGRMRTTKGDLSEPLWYAGLGVLVFCEGHEGLVHKWSEGHADYSSTDTIAKIAHRLESGTGPTTCAHYASIDPKGCLGCPHANQIKSPIVLGRPEPKKKELKQNECEPPSRFRRSDEGLFFESDGVWKKFYDQDLYPTQIAFDESLGYQVVTLRHHLPHEGWLEFKLRSSVINDIKALISALWDNHVIVVGAREKKIMGAYMEGYLQKLQRSRAMSQLYSQMGWKEHNKRTLFVLGKKCYCSDGAVETTSLARNIPSIAEAFHTRGTLEKWIDATEVLDAPGMEPLAFALLAGGFGSPLMKFTGFEGAMLSMVGESGVGKTLMLRFIQSVYGYHKDLLLLRDDTKNMMIARLGTHGNTPVTIDEITNIEGAELSDLVYRVTQGRDKGRLTKSAEEKKNINQWNTLAVVTTNSSLVDKLSGAKHDAGAEINRVFEFPIIRNDALYGESAANLYWTMDENYGHAGDRYLRWLSTHIEEVKTGLVKTQELINKRASVTGEERFWGAVAATAIYGGLVASKQGLIKFNVTRVMDWVVDTIRSMRADKALLGNDAVSILGQFLDEHAANTIVTKSNNGSRRACSVVVPPRGHLGIRRELDSHRLFISRTLMVSWLTKKYGSYTKLRKDLDAMKALVNSSNRKVLGAGTEYSGVQQPCWEINLKCPALGAVGLHLVEELKTPADDVICKLREDVG